MSLNEFEKLFLCLNFEIAKKTDWRSFFFQSVKPVSCQWMTKYQNEKDSTYPAREEKKSWKEIRVWVRKVSSPSSFAKHSTVTSVRTFWLDRCEIVILSFFKFLQSFSPPTLQLVDRYISIRPLPATANAGIYKNRCEISLSSTYRLVVKAITCKKVFFWLCK